jgi:hypothetical protein
MLAQRRLLADAPAGRLSTADAAEQVNHAVRSAALHTRVSWRAFGLSTTR